MAAALPRTQVPSNSAVYEKYFQQLESSGSGRVLAGDAAVFLKKSGLPDLVLGKIWDFADAESKGYLNKQEFCVALQLVACAQNGMEVSLSSLKKVVPPPRFHDNASPSSMTSPIPVDLPWAVKAEEKSKYDAIFDSLNPVNGFLSGDKVKPVLLNSKLPVEVLGRVWELSDIDHDGLLDRDEFAVAMFLVYSALEKEPVPMILPPALVPLAKRRSSGTAASLPIIPPLPMPPSKEPRHSLPPVGILPTKAPVTQWVVSHVEKTKYDEIFVKLDKDQDGLVSGLEVREIFLKTGLPSGLLAHIWSLCDTKDCGKLSKEQFALAFHFINQKLVKGSDPPQILTTEMIPPSERSTTTKAPTPPSAPSPVADFSAIKELDSLNNEIVELQREKTNVEQELNEKEETVKRRTGEVQDLQDEVERESANLKKLQAQRQEVEDVLADLDEQKAKLEKELQELRLQCEEEAQQISLLQAEVSSQETQIFNYEEEVTKAKEELSRLQEETAQLEEDLSQGKERLTPLEQQLVQCREELRLAKLQDTKPADNHINNQMSIPWRAHLDIPMVNGTGDHSSLSNSSSEPTNLHENLEYENLAQPEEPNQSSSVRSSPEITQTSGSDADDKDEQFTVPVTTDKEVTTEVDPFEAKQNAPPAPPVPETGLDFFQNDPFVGSDPFKDDPFGKVDPFGGDPFKDSDPFAADMFFKQSSADPFGSPKTDPFPAAKTEKADPFLTAKTEKADPFPTSKADQADPFLSSKSDPFSHLKADPFTSSDEDPFKSSSADPFSVAVSESSVSSTEARKSNDPFAPGGNFVSATSQSGNDDPFASFFGNDSFGSGFADFSTLSKNNADAFDGTPVIKEKETLQNKSTFETESLQMETPPALPPKTGTPTRPCPPPPGQRPLPKPEDLFKHGDPFQQFNLSISKEEESDPFASCKVSGEAGGLGSFNTVSTN